MWAVVLVLFANAGIPPSPPAGREPHVLLLAKAKTPKAAKKPRKGEPPAKPPVAAEPTPPAAEPPAPPPAPAPAVAPSGAAPAPAPVAPADVLAVLPIRVVGGGAQEAAPLLSTLLAAELEQLSDARVISAGEVDALLQNEAERQGVGARDDGALQEIVGALGARRVVTGELGRQGALHVWHVSLVATEDNSVETRVDVKARTVEALTAQVRDVAFTLLGRADEVKLEGAAAQKRMGLEREEALVEFSRYRQSQPDVTTTEAFTRFLLDHNLESNGMAVAQAVLMMGAALLGAVAIGAGMLSVTALTVFRSPPLVLAFGGLVWLLLLPALAMGTTGLVLAIVDAFNPGRVVVKSDGCCRDDAQIHDESQQTRLRRVAALGISLAGPASIIVGLAGAQIYFLASTFLPAAGIGYKTSDEYSLALVTSPLYLLSTYCMSCSLVCSYACCLLPLCVGSPTGLFLLFWPDKAVVQDVEVPPKPATGAKTQPAATTKAVQP
jgi:hypothetical protein